MLDYFTWYYIERLVLSALEQPTAQVAGCFVAGGDAECSRHSIQPWLNDMVAIAARFMSTQAYTNKYYRLNTLITDFSVLTRNAEINEVNCWMSIIIV